MLIIIYFPYNIFNYVQKVDHVILFDFPQEPSEYLRRVGRTGRAGKSGKATILGWQTHDFNINELILIYFVVYGKQVPIARAVLQASIDGKKIEPGNEL